MKNGNNPMLSSQPARVLLAEKDVKSYPLFSVT